MYHYENLTIVMADTIWKLCFAVSKGLDELNLMVTGKTFPDVIIKALERMMNSWAND